MHGASGASAKSSPTSRAASSPSCRTRICTGPAATPNRTKPSARKWPAPASPAWLRCLMKPGLGIRDWGLGKAIFPRSASYGTDSSDPLFSFFESPIPNLQSPLSDPQSPIPNPESRLLDQLRHFQFALEIRVVDRRGDQAADAEGGFHQEHGDQQFP